MEHSWILGSREGELVDLTARKLIAYIYGDLMRRMPDGESREKLRKQLNKSETEASGSAPVSYDDVRGVPEGWRPGVDVPVPDWWDEGDPWDAKPEFQVGSDGASDPIQP